MSNREAYIRKFQAQLDEWNADIDKLEAKAQKSKADAKIEYQKHLEQLRAKRDNAASKLEELKSASDDAWEDVKRGAEDAWQTCSDAVKKAVSRFK